MFMAFPAILAAAADFVASLGSAGTALLGGAAVATTASLSGDTAQDNAKTKPVARTLPRTDEPCKKCPAEEGSEVRNNHGVNWNAYEYQARITGFAFDTERCLWSMEWNWQGIDFDGFKAEQCLLQEAKGNYDQFFVAPGKPEPWFQGFKVMESTIQRQAATVRVNPPAKLTWYFQTPLTRNFVLATLRNSGVVSVVQP